MFSYLFAKNQGGKFILRIEDTDRNRSSVEAKENIRNELERIGIIPDEYFVQSERLNFYQDAADILVESGAAYRCYCDKARLSTLEGGYDNYCRDNNQVVIGKPYVVRLKLSGGPGYVSFLDGLLGPIKFDNENLPPDPVILKSDKYPTYHLAAVVDDHLMRVTHVLRSQEWLSSTPIHLKIYKEMDWNPPVFFHLPTINDSTGKKIKQEIWSCCQFWRFIGGRVSN